MALQFLPRLFLFTLLVCVFDGGAVGAQPAMMIQDGAVLPRPVCGVLVNKSDVTIQGSVATKPQMMPDGQTKTHTINFRLTADERTQICAQGPFYTGQRVTLTIRSLVPLFECQTRIDREIALTMTEEDDGIKRYSATCF